MYSKNELIITTDMMMVNDQLTIYFKIVNDHPLFLEHFPGLPTLPGSYLVSYLIDVLQQNRKAIRMVKEVTFMNRLIPGQSYTAVAKFVDNNVRILTSNTLENNRMASLTLGLQS